MYQRTWSKSSIALSPTAPFEAVTERKLSYSTVIWNPIQKPHTPIDDVMTRLCQALQPLTSPICTPAFTRPHRTLLVQPKKLLIVGPHCRSQICSPENVKRSRSCDNLFGGKKFGRCPTRTAAGSQRMYSKDASGWRYDLFMVHNRAAIAVKARRHRIKTDGWLRRCPSLLRI